MDSKESAARLALQAVPGGLTWVQVEQDAVRLPSGVNLACAQAGAGPEWRLARVIDADALRVELVDVRRELAPSPVTLIDPDLQWSSPQVDSLPADHVGLRVAVVDDRGQSWQLLPAAHYLGAFMVGVLVTLLLSLGAA